MKGVSKKEKYNISEKKTTYVTSNLSKKFNEFNAVQKNSQSHPTEG